MRILCCLCLVLLTGGLLSAQTVLWGPGSTRGFQAGKAGPQTLVRDSGGSLYVIYRYQVSTINTEWRLAIGQSKDKGATWNMTWQTGFDSYTVGGYGNLYPCMAIDSKDNLHCAWWTRGTSTSYYTRYNRFDAANQTWGTEWAVSTSSHRSVPCLAVDQNDYVWFAYNKPSYQTYLDRSNLPFASDGKFTRYAPTFPGGGSSSSNFEMAVDAANRLHVTYYDATASTSGGGAGVKHRWIDPGASTPTWSAKADLSFHSGDYARAEYESSLSADNAGNMYVIYTVDSQGGNSSRTKDTEFYLRKWDSFTQKWGNPVLVHSVPITVWHPGYLTSTKDYNSGVIIGSACDETTGELYFTYRDFTSGDFVLGRWRGDDTEPHSIYAKLMNTAPLPPTNRNYFFAPHFRGSLWPKSNRTSWGLDLMYVAGDQTTAKIYTDYFEHFPLASMNSTGVPKIGTVYTLDLNSIEEGSQNYVAAATMSGLMSMIQVKRRFIPLVADTLFYTSVLNLLPTIFVDFIGGLDPNGMGKAKIAIPNLGILVGANIDCCFVTYDGTGLRAISNPWNFLITN